MMRSLLSVVLSSSVVLALPAWASVPTELEAALTTLIEAANERQLDAVLEQYDPAFKSNDGLTLDDTRAAIADLWRQYPELTYTAAVDTWDEATQTAIITTTLSGTASTGYAVSGNLTVENRYSDTWAIAEQTVLAETITLTQGEAPPTVTLTLPPAVRLGSVYDIEAIVEEPLGDRMMLGALLETPVTPSGYQDIQGIFPLEPLRAGGIFLRDEAPFLPETQWLGVMIVSNGGITLQEQRLRVLTGSQLEALGL